MNDSTPKINNEYITDSDDIREYHSYIKENIDTGNYFKEALNWYHLKYTSQITERAYFIIAIILLLWIALVVKTMSDSLFPLVVQQPIFIPAKNNADWVPKIVKLKPRKGEPNFDPRVENFDDSIIKYLLKSYVMDRESFNFKEGNVEEINKKFNRIKNTSNFREFKNFQKYMSKDNPNSPIKLFSKNAIRNIAIDEIKFYRKQPKNFAEKILIFIANSIPLEADVFFTANITTFDDIGLPVVVTEKFMAKIKYEYQPFFKTNTQANINFSVSQYVLYKVKN